MEANWLPPSPLVPSSRSPFAFAVLLRFSRLLGEPQEVHPGHEDGLWVSFFFLQLGLRSLIMPLRLPLPSHFSLPSHLSTFFTLAIYLETPQLVIVYLNSRRVRFILSWSREPETARLGFHHLDGDHVDWKLTLMPFCSLKKDKDRSNLITWMKEYVYFPIRHTYDPEANLCPSLSSPPSRRACA